MNSKDPKPFETLSYFALALDPVHVGTGGYRLGRVDMSIVREPGTNLPKIPGTSLAGAWRTYTTLALASENPDANLFPHCAGQGQEKKEREYNGHCGNHSCPICVTFGFSKGEQSSFQGLAQFFDGHLVLFPVHSLVGPVWVTCQDSLKEIGLTEPGPSDDSKVRVASDIKTSGKLNLGWVMLEIEANNFSLDGKLGPVPVEILKRAVIVSNKMFGHIVNDNLEVRTSVSIDPATGAAADGALYTYEAIPRSSVLAFDVVVSHPKFYKIGGRIPLEGKIENVVNTVEKGRPMFGFLGVGGMGTRGMGRLRIFAPLKGR